MDLAAVDDSELRFSAYVEGLVSVIGHADRVGPLPTLQKIPEDEITNSSNASPFRFSIIVLDAVG